MGRLGELLAAMSSTTDGYKGSVGNDVPAGNSKVFDILMASTSKDFSSFAEGDSVEEIDVADEKEGRPLERLEEVHLVADLGASRNTEININAEDTEITKPSSTTRPTSELDQNAELDIVALECSAATLTLEELGEVPIPSAPAIEVQERTLMSPAGFVMVALDSPHHFPGDLHSEKLSPSGSLTADPSIESTDPNLAGMKLVSIPSSQDASQLAPATSQDSVTFEGTSYGSKDQTITSVQGEFFDAMKSTTVVTVVDVEPNEVPSVMDNLPRTMASILAPIENEEVSLWLRSPKRAAISTELEGRGPLSPPEMQMPNDPELASRKKSEVDIQSAMEVLDDLERPDHPRLLPHTPERPNWALAPDITEAEVDAQSVLPASRDRGRLLNDLVEISFSKHQLREANPLVGGPQVQSVSPAHTARNPNWALAPDIAKPAIPKKTKTRRDSRTSLLQAADSKGGHHGRKDKSSFQATTRGAIPPDNTTPRGTFGSGASFSVSPNTSEEAFLPFASGSMVPPQSEAASATSRLALATPALWAFSGSSQRTDPLTPPALNWMESSLGMESSWPSSSSATPRSHERHLTPTFNRSNGQASGAIRSPALGEFSFTSAMQASEYADTTVPVIVNVWERSNLRQHSGPQNAPRHGAFATSEARGKCISPPDAPNFVFGRVDERKHSREGQGGSILVGPTESLISQTPPASHYRGPGGLDRTFPTQEISSWITHMEAPSQRVELPRSDHHGLVQQPHPHARNHVTVRGVSQKYMGDNSASSIRKQCGGYSHDLSRKKEG